MGKNPAGFAGVLVPEAKLASMENAKCATCGAGSGTGPWAEARKLSIAQGSADLLNANSLGHGTAGQTLTG
jgi:hypothetical protein